jgi:DhnA family fructose-bisphosphate aldolase class Ia
MIADAGRVVDAGRSLGVPVLMMAYARAAPGESSGDPVAAALAARAAAEIGASIVQTNFAGASDGLRTIVRACPVPVVVAGGPRAPSEEAFLDGLRGMLRAGATGLSVGRQVFQAVDPAAVACRIADTLFGSDPPIAVEAAR